MKPSVEVLQFGKQTLLRIIARMEEIQMEWAELVKQRDAWLVILGEDSTAGNNETPAEEQADQPPSTAVGDPTEVTRKVISSTGEQGFKPKDITSKVEAIRGSLASGFVSNLLFRMKKRGEVVEHNGKYYLPKFDPKPRLNMSGGKD